MLSVPRVLRVAGAVAGIALIHFSFIGGHEGAGFYGIMLLALLGMLSGPLIFRLIFLAVGAAAVVSALVPGGTVATPYMLLAAPLLVNAAAMLVFGLTLLPGKVPLITRFSRYDRRQTESPAVDSHTRRLTKLWTVYFAGIVISTIFMAAAGSFVAASWIVTVLSPVGSAALFLAEHLYRYLRKDIFGQASVTRTLRLIAQPDAWRGIVHDG